MTIYKNFNLIMQLFLPAHLAYQLSKSLFLNWLNPVQKTAINSIISEVNKKIAFESIYNCESF